MFSFTHAQCVLMYHLLWLPWMYSSCIGQRTRDANALYVGKPTFNLFPTYSLYTMRMYCRFKIWSTLYYSICRLWVYVLCMHRWICKALDVTFRKTSLCMNLTMCRRCSGTFKLSDWTWGEKGGNSRYRIGYNQYTHLLLDTALFC